VRSRRADDLLDIDRKDADGSAHARVTPPIDPWGGPLAKRALPAVGAAKRRVYLGMGGGYIALLDQAVDVRCWIELEDGDLSGL